MKTDVPKLLGFSHANIYMLDEMNKNLYAISLDEDAEQRARESYGTFEVEFAFEES